MTTDCEWPGCTIDHDAPAPHEPMKDGAAVSRRRTCDYICLLEDDHDSDHFFGYRIPDYSDLAERLAERSALSSRDEELAAKDSEVTRLRAALWAIGEATDTPAGTELLALNKIRTVLAAALDPPVAPDA